MSENQQNVTSVQGEGIHGVLPPLKQVIEHGGAPFRPTAGTRVVIAEPAQAVGLLADAELLAAELARLPTHGFQEDGPRVRDAQYQGDPASRQVAVGVEPQPGDVVLRLVEALGGATSPEAYRLETTAQQANITATTATGVFYGTRTLLQSLVLSGGIQACTVVDEPAKPVRGLHVDVGRKYFSPAWLHQQVRELAWCKLNEFQLHFSDNEGFRLESRSHPEVVSQEHLSQDELRALLAEAARYRVRVVPALDVPGHMRCALEAHPELRASDTEAGRLLLDYSRPQARALVTDLLDELVPLFGTQVWHLGGDEVFPMGGPAWDKEQHERLARDFPQLAAYAQEQVGPQATVLDGYLHYLGTVVARLRSLGVRQVRAWNDALYLPGTSVGLNSDVVITYWTAWHQGFAPVERFVQTGHRVINFNDSVFYYVLTTPGRAYWDRPSVQSAYEWRPGVFPRLMDGRPQSWQEGQDPWNLGALFSVWCDVPEAQTEAEVAEGVRPRLRAMGSRLWRPETAVPFALWREREERLGAAI
ncbi:family 20 glycosylhydrolase [Actinomyces trachealis]|uniref:family 20 glycosylhydrolase n=1 Tax=Actinomyces trachealis TaxID=2763540 RepID=UPI0018C562B0|nr:family 20 glycosylhydrolase [Actinomyces trachealis]